MTVPPGTEIDVAGARATHAAPVTDTLIELDFAAFDGTPECVSFTANGPDGDVQSFVHATTSGDGGAKDIAEDIEMDPADCTA